MMSIECVEGDRFFISFPTHTKISWTYDTRSIVIEKDMLKIGIGLSYNVSIPSWMHSRHGCHAFFPLPPCLPLSFILSVKTRKRFRCFCCHDRMYTRLAELVYSGLVRSVFDFESDTSVEVWTPCLYFLDIHAPLYCRQKFRIIHAGICLEIIRRPGTKRSAEYVKCYLPRCLNLRSNTLPAKILFAPHRFPYFECLSRL